MTHSLYRRCLFLYLMSRDYSDCLMERFWQQLSHSMVGDATPIYETISDEYIVELLNSDKERGFRALYDRYYVPLTIYAIRLTDSSELAEDIVQELLISIWEKKLWCNIRGNFRSYLFWSVRNNALAQLRKKGNKSIEEISNIHCEVPVDDYDEVDMELKRIQIEEELRRLPQREYEAVQKVIMEGKRYIDAAHELNISVNTLKTHLSRATTKLRKSDML